MSPVLLIVIPLILGFISVFLKKYGRHFLVIAALFNSVSVFFYDQSLYNIGHFTATYSINLLFDDYAFVATALINIIFLLIVVVNFDSIKEAATVLLISLAGVNGLLLTNDLFNLFVFIEISSIAAYILTAQNKKLLYSFNYLVIGSVGSSLYLLGLILLYAMTGTLNMTEVMKNVTPQDIIIPLFLMFIGLGVEAKLLPFGSWAKGILEHANKLVGPIIASIYAGTILFVFGRLFDGVFILDDNLKMVIVFVGAITLIAGEFAAFASHKLREILLFSSVAQAGLVVILFVNDLQSVAILLIGSIVLSKFILFTIAGFFSETHQEDTIENLSGIFTKNRILGFSFSVASLSIAGLPLFFGFIVKFNVLFQLFDSGQYVIPALILFTSVIEGAYIIRMNVHLWNGGQEGEYAMEPHQPMTPTKIALDWSVFVVSLVILFLGIYPLFYQIIIDKLLGGVI